jgi:DNA-binding NarL/FixJ family response regulator
MKTKILITDDHAMVREGLRLLLNQFQDMTVVEEACNGHEAMLKAEKTQPDVVLMDYEMPNFNGVYATREIRSLCPRTKILILSTYSTKEYIISAIHAGAHGYLPKETGINDIVTAIRELASGGTWFKGEIAELITPYLVASVGKNGKQNHSNRLTGRESELIKYWARGLTSREIADALSISKRTVEVHKANIFKKLGLKNTTELIRYAAHNQLIKL